MMSHQQKVANFGGNLRSDRLDHSDGQVGSTTSFQGEEMTTTQHCTSYWGGLHKLTHVLDGEWVPAILATLAHGPRHFTEILDAIQVTGTGQPDPQRRLHDSILSRTLRRMEDKGLITRHEVAATFPKSTTYELTSWATDLLTALLPAVHWTNSRPADSQHHSGRVDRRQFAADATRPTLAMARPHHSIG